MIHIKIVAETSGWGLPWMAYSEQLGGIDYDWTGDGWRNCGSPQGHGKTIQEAIDDFMYWAWEILAKDNPNDKRFDDLNFEPPYTWS